MKKLYILILGLIIFANCHSQDWQWSNSISGNGNEKAQLITVDSNGYIYAIIGVSGEVNIVYVFKTI